MERRREPRITRIDTNEEFRVGPAKACCSSEVFLIRVDSCDSRFLSGILLLPRTSHQLPWFSWMIPSSILSVGPVPLAVEPAAEGFLAARDERPVSLRVDERVRLLAGREPACLVGQAELRPVRREEDVAGQALQHAER